MMLEAMAKRLGARFVTAINDDGAMKVTFVADWGARGAAEVVLAHNGEIKSAFELAETKLRALTPAPLAKPDAEAS